MATILGDDKGGTREVLSNARLAGALVLILAIAAVVLLASGAAAPVARGGGGQGAAAAPRMDFMHGMLTSEGTGGVKIGTVTLVFTAESNVVIEGKQATADRLSDDLEATVMGRRAGGSFIVEQCTAARPVPPRPRASGDGGIEWSTEDPTVGSGRQPY